MNFLTSSLDKLGIGVVSSVGTYIILWLRDYLKYRYLYSAFDGRYGLCHAETPDHVEGHVSVEHTGGRSFTITSNSSSENWVSRIVMSTDIQDLGQGIYQYGSKFDCGIHQIQLNRKDNIIYVFGQNTSRADLTKYTFILRRTEPFISAGRRWFERW